jgi:hypothetical protein
MTFRITYLLTGTEMYIGKTETTGNSMMGKTGNLLAGMSPVPGRNKRGHRHQALQRVLQIIMTRISWIVKTPIVPVGCSKISIAMPVAVCGQGVAVCGEAAGNFFSASHFAGIFPGR